MKRANVAAMIGLSLGALSAPYWVPRIIWERQPWQVERVLLVDYTVPFASAREHRGTAWVLNHEKYRSPEGGRWTALGSHVGYHPDDRAHPVPIAAADLRDVDWIVVSDAYGVYRDDLRDPGRERAHMDYSERLFGGLSVADADSLAAHLARGRHLLLEFNALEEPTSPEARAMLEGLLGVHWTGWTARLFLDLRDTTDVPHWLPRLHRERYGNDALPRGANLALVHRDGRLFYLSAPQPWAAAPHVAMTDAGRRALPAATGGAPYYYWFPVIAADSGTEVLAELALPPLAARDSVLRAAGIPAVVPLLTRRVVRGAHRLYLAADLSDTDFDPGTYDLAGLGWLRTRFEDNPYRVDGQNAFWQFYVPALAQLLRTPFDGPPLAPASRAR